MITGQFWITADGKLVNIARTRGAAKRSARRESSHTPDVRFAVAGPIPDPTVLAGFVNGVEIPAPKDD